MNKVIGGEFSLSLNDLTNNSAKDYEGYLYASGRSALYYICKQLVNDGCKRMWLPCYLCSSILNTLTKFPSITILTYELDSEFMPDFNTIDLNYGDSFLVINYFSLLDTECMISGLKRSRADIVVVVDNVQAYFEMNPASVADYQFTSFRKTLGTPDGAWAIARNNKILEQPTSENNFSHYKIAGALLKEAAKSIRLNDHIYMQLIDMGETAMCNDYDRTINSNTLKYLSSIDEKWVIQRRRENSAYVISELKKIDIEPMIKIDLNRSVPLFVPILLNNRDNVRNALRKANIFCPVHWENSPNELSLVIDQRYTPYDLERMINIIKSNI